MATRAAAICGVYFILCVANGRIYVGSSKDCERRWREHFKKLELNSKGVNPIMRNAYVKHGKASFVRGLLELVADPGDLLVREQLWLDSGAATFNIAKQVGRPPLRYGFKLSPAHIEKRSATRRGKKLAPSTCKKLSEKFSKLYLFEGDMLTLNNISKRTGIKRSTIRTRLRNRIPLETPLRSPKKWYAYLGEQMTLAEISTLTGVSRQTLSYRIKKGRRLV